MNLSLETQTAQDFQMAAYASASPEPQLLAAACSLLETPLVVRSHGCAWKPMISLFSLAHVKKCKEMRRNVLYLYFGLLWQYDTSVNFYNR